MRWVYRRSAFVRYVITKFSCFHSLPIYFSNGAPTRALRARELRYYWVVLAIKFALKSVKLTPPDDRTSENVLAKLVSNSNPSQLAYKAFINKKHTLPIKSKQNGKEIVNSKMRRISTGVHLFITWKCTLSTKLRNFQLNSFTEKLRPMYFDFDWRCRYWSLLLLSRNAYAFLLGLSRDESFLK